MALFGQLVIYRSRILLQIASKNKQAILLNFIGYSRTAKNRLLSRIWIEGNLDVRKEMNKLKEMITLIDADHGER